MTLSRIEVDLAERGSELSDHANEVLSCFKGFGHTGYLFNVDTRPAVLSVGYEGDEPVVAASSYIDRDEPISDDADTVFCNLPYVSIYLIATEQGYKRRGYASLVVNAMTNLASVHNFGRVEAVQPSGDAALQFWSENDFERSPFETSHLRMFKRTGGLVDDVICDVIVSPRAVNAFGQAA